MKGTHLGGITVLIEQRSAGLNRSKRVPIKEERNEPGLGDSICESFWCDLSRGRALFALLSNGIYDSLRLFTEEYLNAAISAGENMTGGFRLSTSTIVQRHKGGHRVTFPSILQPS